MKAQILAMLKEAGDYVSGEKISQQLGVTRTAIWKNMNTLRSEGYVIRSVRNKGYLLEKSPNLLDAEMISNGLNTHTVGTDIVVMKSVDSTNEEVKRRAAQGEKAGLVVVSDEQSAGKGRLGRVWKSSTGGIYFTLLIRPELPPSDIASITLAAGLAVCLAIREYTDCPAQIKWPNDIIIGNKKVCGILTEMAAQSDRLDFVAIGIGINVNHTEFPEEIRHKATSLFLETGREIDRNDFFRTVLKKLDKVLSSFLVSVSMDDVNQFRQLCATIGREVSLERGGEKIVGIAKDITTSGELLIESNGKKITVNSGEVTVQGIY